MAGPLGTRAQRHPVYLIPTRTVGRGGPWIGGPGVGLWMPVPPEPDGRVVLPVPWVVERKRRPLQGGGWSWLGRCEGLPTLGPDITTHPQPLSQAWDGNTDKNTNTPRQAGLLSDRNM